MTADATILDRVSAYFADKVRAHGDTPAGVDWKSAEQQSIRFGQLMKLCPATRAYSLLDYGCGYGALLDYLKDINTACSYYGYDVCGEMISAARRRHPGEAERFTSELEFLPNVDFVVASGVFNVKGNTTEDHWQKHVLRSIDEITRMSRSGFAFNVLTTHVDFRRSDLYYADPDWYADYCKSNYDCDVTVLQNYGLYEFTLLARR